MECVNFHGHSNYQIGPNMTKSEIPSTKSGTFFGLAFLPMLIYRELNFDTDCFNAYVTSCSYTSSEWSTKDLVRVANYSRLSVA